MEITIMVTQPAAPPSGLTSQFPKRMGYGYPRRIRETPSERILGRRFDW
jgi:hypothetical protein